MESARSANANDVGRIGELAAELAAELTPTRGGDVWSRREAPKVPYEQHYHALLAHDLAAELAVGTIDSIVVGYGAVRVERLRDDSQLGVIDELFVEVGAREVGVAEAIIDHLTAWCATAGCFGVDARALPGNRQAKNFFEAHGFVARSLTMHHRFERE